MANKNTLRKNAARLKAYARYKRGRDTFPAGMAPFGEEACRPKDNKPKVAASGGRKTPGLR